MALSGPEKARLRALLGWGARYHDIDDGLENAMDALATTPDDETKIRSILTELDTIDVLITGARDTAGVLVAGSIQLAGDSGLGVQRSEGRRLVMTIGQLLGVDVRRNYYGGGAPKGGTIQYG